MRKSEKILLLLYPKNTHARILYMLKLFFSQSEIIPSAYNILPPVW
jgi:hypothetical protein